jgi:hypothetical protein
VRSPTLIFAILCASVALGSNLQWKDAKVIKISSESAASLPALMGTGNVGQVHTTKTYYWIETDDTVYVLGPTITKEWLNVTLHSTTKIAIEGRNAHILDAAGKDKKMSIAKQVARTKTEDDQKLTAADK